MRNVSRNYIETMKDRRDFYPVAQITFADGTEKTLSRNDFITSGNTITESAESSSFPLGVLASKRITLSLINDDDRWSDYAFYGAKIFLRTMFDLDDGTTETINIGTFTVITPESYGTTISLTAMDDSYKTDTDYSTGLSYPLTAGEALRDSCEACGITLGSTSFPNSGYTIQTRPENVTHRQFIGMIAMIAGGNAVLDEYNRLMIKSYDFSEFEKAGLDGGVFDSGMPAYQTGDSADGGSFAPWDTGYVMDGGAFGDRDNIHVLYEFKSGITIGVDDVVITGVQIDGEDENGDKTPHLYGSEGYVLSLENQLATGKEDEVVRLIGQAIVGLRFRPFSGEHIAYPMAEFMDVAYIADFKNNVYQTVLTDVSFTYYGFTSLKCAADSPIRNSSTYYGNETKAIVKARQMVAEERTERERVIEGLTTRLDQSSGLYTTVVNQADGSKIFYLHDKPNLNESMILWKMTVEAWGVSTDGGTHYNGGMTVDGDTIVRILEAVGINFDWAHGGTLTLGGRDNENGTLKVLDANGTQVGKWDKDGIDSSSGTIISRNNQTAVVIGGGRFGLVYGSTNVGFIGTNYFATAPSQAGLEFDLELEGSYMCWACRLWSDDPSYFYQFLFANKDFGDFKKNYLYFASYSSYFLNPAIFGTIQEPEGQIARSGNGLTIAAEDGMRINLAIHNNDSYYIYFELSDEKIHVARDIDMNFFKILNQSDERLKTNIEESNVDGLDIINAIKTYSFDWIEDEHHTDLGFIAQQLEAEVDADFVSVDKEDSHYSVKEMDMIPYLVKAVQELSAQVDELKSEISKLKGETAKVRTLRKSTKAWAPKAYTMEEKNEFVNKLKAQRTTEIKHSDPIKAGGEYNGYTDETRV